MPRAGLTTEVVVAEAAAAADELGLHNLTLAVLAARLDVRSPSLYRHVNGLPELQRLLALRGAGELGAALRAAPASLAGLAQAYRRYAVSHPGVYAAAQRADPSDPDLVRLGGLATDPIFALLASYGIGEADRVHAARIVRSLLHGFVALEAMGGFGLRESPDETFEKSILVLEAGLRRSLGDG